MEDGSDWAGVIREAYGDSAQDFLSKNGEILGKYRYKYQLKDASVLSDHAPCENCFLRATLSFLGGGKETRTIPYAGLPVKKAE